MAFVVDMRDRRENTANKNKLIAASANFKFDVEGKLKAVNVVGDKSVRGR